MPLSAEQAYHFDVRGWLVVDAALSLEQLQACRAAIAAATATAAAGAIDCCALPEVEALHRHPALLVRLEELLGATFADLDAARAAEAAGAAPYGQIGLDQERVPDAPFRVDRALALVEPSATAEAPLRLRGREPDRVQRLRYEGTAQPVAVLEHVPMEVGTS
jgi:hypothetical protein